PAPMRRVHFYVYIALVLLIGGFMGNVYSVPIADGAVISGGNLCYGAFMMASVMFVWVERDTFILRHLVRLVIFVNIFKIVFAFLTQALLRADGVINTHNVPPVMFEASTYLIVVGGVLIIAELLILLFIFEAAKKRISSPLAARQWRDLHPRVHSCPRVGWLCLFLHCLRRRFGNRGHCFRRHSRQGVDG